MALTDENAPWREPIRFAKIRHILWKKLRAAARHMRPQPRGLAHLSDHLVRDIGLDAADLEALRHQWPSETTHHPRG